MTKDEIKAALRRAALQEKYPVAYLFFSHPKIFDKAMSYKGRPTFGLGWTQNTRRVFLLLVAEAI